MAIHACEFGGESERALAYVRTMGSASGLKPAAKQYEAAIKAMVSARRFRDAYQLLAEAVEVRGLACLRASGSRGHCSKNRGIERRLPVGHGGGRV